MTGAATMDPAPARTVLPGAWTAETSGGIEGLMHRLGPEQLAAIDEAVRATEGRGPTDVGAAEFGGVMLDDLMAAVRYELAHGRGVSVLSGLDLTRYTPEQFQRLYFGLGSHLGTPVEQSPRHDRLGFVRKEPNPDLRGYLMDTELGPHTDYHEVLSLATVVAAETGGVSGFVSSAAIYAAIRDERPDLLPALLEGFPYPTGADSVTDYKVPTISIVDGHVSIYSYVIFIFQAAAIMGVEVPAKLIEGLRFMAAVARRPGMIASFTMQPGEMAFWYNFRVMHSRTSFRNTPERQRELLRLWLHAREPRPMARGYREIAQALDEHHAAGRSMLVNTVETMGAIRDALAG